MRKRLRDLWSITKETGEGWDRDHVSSLAAGLAYYTLLSLAPLVVIAIAVAGFVFGEDAARHRIADELGGVVGDSAARAIQDVIRGAQAPEAGVVSTVVGVVVLFLGASGVFAELQSSLNTVWNVKPKPGRGVRGIVKDRFFSFSMVLGVAFLLLVSTILSAALAAVGRYLGSALPGGEALWQVVNLALSLAMVTALFALIFKIVPDAEVAWKDVWIGAAVTSVLFTLGKFLIGLYLGKSSVSSSYGAAGSLVVLVIWVYYSAQILLLGAEFTQAYAQRFGSHVEPSANAVPADAPEEPRTCVSDGAERRYPATSASFSAKRPPSSA
jgi:membrane protein